MLRRLFVLIICGVAAPGGVVAQQASKERPHPDRELVYKRVKDVQLKLHMFEPPGHQAADRRPAIVFFFGGGWNGGTPSQFYPHCRYLADRGMVAFSAEYRVKSRHQTPPSVCVEDGKSAVRFIRGQAARLGIDPQQLAAGGGSAGGHVAAATATVDRFDAASDDLKLSAIPTALVLFNPVYDNGPDGYGHDRVKDYWKDISPLHNIDEDVPPAIVFLGTEDKLIPVETGRQFQKRMAKFGTLSELHLYEGQPHGFFNFGRSNNRFYDDTVAKMDRFLVQVGLLNLKKDKAE